MIKNYEEEKYIIIYLERIQVGGSQRNKDYRKNTLELFTEQVIKQAKPGSMPLSSTGFDGTYKSDHNIYDKLGGTAEGKTSFVPQFWEL